MNLKAIIIYDETIAADLSNRRLVPHSQQIEVMVKYANFYVEVYKTESTKTATT